MRKILPLLFLLASLAAVGQKQLVMYHPRGPRMKLKKEPEVIGFRPNATPISVSPREQFSAAYLDLERMTADSGTIWFMLSSKEQPNFLFPKLDSIVLTASNNATLPLAREFWRDSMWTSNYVIDKYRTSFFLVCFLNAADIAFLKQNRVREIVFMGRNATLPLTLSRRSGEAFYKRMNEEW
ncbi:MAG TPA: hypothetical protein VNW04_03865 [Puia sp.]|jgi:hypothetical protein|nr:hypothetical protein [Puia sp.]